jgi:hypothetical protein
MCVCVCERERERERDKDRERDRERESESLWNLGNMAWESCEVRLPCPSSTRTTPLLVFCKD